MGIVDKVLFKTMTQLKIKDIAILFKTVQRKVSVKETELLPRTDTHLKNLHSRKDRKARYVLQLSLVSAGQN